MHYGIQWNGEELSASVSSLATHGLIFHLACSNIVISLDAGILEITLDFLSSKVFEFGMSLGLTNNTQARRGYTVGGVAGRI
jgi:hypothetical protein